MPRPRLIWRMFPRFFLIAAVAIAVTAGAAARAVRNAAYAQQWESLETVARLADALLLGEPSTPVPPAFHEAIQRLAGDMSLRITLMDAQGAPLADSVQDATRLENQLSMPEVAAALAGTVGRSRRQTTFGQETLFVAVPGQSAAVVRAGRPVSLIQAGLRPIYIQVALAAFLATLLAGALSYSVYYMIQRPLFALREGVERYANGQFDQPVPVPHTEEIAALAQTLNRMAQRIRDRNTSQAADNYELEAVLSSMIESVLAVDESGRILKLNPAAAALFKVPVAVAEGRILQEVIRNRDLHEFVRTTLAQDGVLEGEIVLFDDEERFLHAHGAPLRNAAGKSIGGVIVLNDVTRLHRLESARSEFVANVSHELRTPITSIIGYAETLQDGALESPEDSVRFIGIIARQAQRLNALIEDLLALSRIERGAEEGGIEMAPGLLSEVLDAALAASAVQARAAGVSVNLETEVAHDAHIVMNEALLQQAFTNLIENAIKYSDPDATVRMHAHTEDDHIRVDIIDQGCGISKEHLPRLFERFYRVDEDRSRRRGGTGLGLAIVKHVIRVHEGTVQVDSEPGRGSTFSVALPIWHDPICPHEPAPATMEPGG